MKTILYGRIMKTAKTTSDRHYGLWAIGLTIVALALGSQALASALDYQQANWLGELFELPLHASVTFIAAGLLALSAGALVIYFKHLNPLAPSRPAGWVFLNFFAPAAFVAMALAAWELGDERTAGPMTLLAAPAVALAVPLALMVAESFAGTLCRRMGEGAQERGWRRGALKAYRASLAIMPGRRALQRACGLLHGEEDEFAEAAVLLARLGPVETLDDEPVVRTLERAYRALGRRTEAFECLRRLTELKPSTPSIDQRLLDDLLYLERNQEALDLIESGRIRETFDLLLLRERLYLKLGNFAQATVLVSRIAEQESAPYRHAIERYEELLALVPENVEIKVSLGLLLLEELSEQRRAEGASILESIVEADPHRLYLCRKLVDYYLDHGAEALATEHMKRLIDGGDPDPEAYLRYAQMLQDEELWDDAAEVLLRLIEVAPEEGRGRLRLARICFVKDDLDGAEKELQRASELAGDELSPSICHLRRDIEHRRSELALERMSRLIEENWDDVEQRLALIDRMIDMDWIDQALAHCDDLLEEHPELTGAVERMVSAGIGRVQRRFRLQDYLADLLLNQARYEDLLGLYRQMASQSLHPDATLSDGCRKILGRAPMHPGARIELAHVRQRAEDWAGVVEALDPLMDRPELPSAEKASWVEAAYRTGRLAEATALGLKLVNATAGDARFMILLIDMLQEQGEHDLALEVFQKAKAANPADRKLRELEQGLVSRREKNRLERLKLKHREGALTLAEHYEMADLLAEHEALEEAIVHYQRSADDPELAPQALLKMAVILCDRGMYDLADETIENVELTRERVQAEPKLKELMYNVAVSLQRARRAEKAVKYFKRIFRVDAAYQDVVDRLERLS